MKDIKFKPKCKTLDQISEEFDRDTIKYEPMIFSGDFEFAREHGGYVTNLFLDRLEKRPEFKQALTEKNNYNLVFDSRVTMTMKGQYPSIPGWHCDDVPRVYGSQPKFELVDDAIKHYMVILSDSPNVSCTEFITETQTIPIDAENVWNSLHKYEEQRKPPTRRIKSGEIIEFNQMAVHRATPCENPGWRYFARASITYRQPVNEIRQQVQIYAPIEEAGW